MSIGNPLREDSLGRAYPQLVNEAGNDFEDWKGKDNHGNVRSDDGKIESIGAKNDPEAEGNGSVIAILKRLRTLLGNIVLGAGSALIGKVQIRNVADDANINPLSEETFNQYAAKNNISNVAAITPDDTGDIEAHAIYVGVTGDVKADFKNGGSAIVLKGLTAGVWHKMEVVRVYAADTTATDILGAFEVV